MATTAPASPLGTPAPDFALPGTDGRTYRRDDIAGPSGLLVMFICNHCPFVLGALERIKADARTLQARGFGVVAISSNDIEAYPQDAPDKMADLAAAEAFPFPYLFDADQSVARAYGAACTPDYFGFDAAGRLCYRGRLDDAGKDGPLDGRTPELVAALTAVADGAEPPAAQIPSMGCSIKWRAA